MNKQQRKQLNGYATGVRLVLDQLAEDSSDGKRREYMERLDNIHTDIEAIRDEEQTKYDNMPESLQGSSKGDEVMEGIDTLDTIITELGDGIDHLKGDDEEVSIDDAVESLENVADNLESF